MPDISSYEQFMRGEGIPIVTGYSVQDVRALERADWPRTGGKGTFIDLKGMEGFTGAFVAEIPPGQALAPQKHMYQIMVFILEGRGAAEVSLPREGARKVTFEWGAGSMFAVPLNCWYRLYNTSAQPATYLAVTDAPLVMDLYHDMDFVFHNDYCFTARFDEAPDYFTGGNRSPHFEGTLWDTNFVPDVLAAFVDDRVEKGAGVRRTTFEMAENSLAGHLGDEPIGMHGKAHHHGGGAVILLLRSQGYTLMWPSDLGLHPFEAGAGDRVVRVPWGPYSIVSPPTNWFHQHFNLGDELARHIAFRFGNTLKHPTRFYIGTHPIDGRAACLVSQRKGGTMIEYPDEDPAIHRLYEEALQARGRSCEMNHALFQPTEAQRDVVSAR